MGMSANPNREGVLPTSHDRPAHGARQPYVAPRLGPGQSVRELTRAVTGSVGDGGGGGTGMMQMAGV
jgi:hypothetical protein